MLCSSAQPRSEVKGCLLRDGAVGSRSRSFRSVVAMGKDGDGQSSLVPWIGCPRLIRFPLGVSDRPWSCLHAVIGGF